MAIPGLTVCQGPVARYFDQIAQREHVPTAIPRVADDDGSGDLWPGQARLPSRCSGRSLLRSACLALATPLPQRTGGNEQPLRHHREGPEGRLDAPGPLLCSDVGGPLRSDLSPSEGRGRQAVPEHGAAAATQRLVNRSPHEKEIKRCDEDALQLVAPWQPAARIEQDAQANALILMVPPPRLERGTPRSTIWCSNQLS